MSDLDKSAVFTQSFLLQAKGEGSKKIFITYVISSLDSTGQGAMEKADPEMREPLTELCLKVLSKLKKRLTLDFQNKVHITVLFQ